MHGYDENSILILIPKIMVSMLKTKCSISKN